MDLAWSAANAVICRSGAATIAEQITFEVPGILVPFPAAADDHQTMNALFVERRIGGAITCPEVSLNVAALKGLIENLLVPERLDKMRSSISAFKQDNRKRELWSLICEILEKTG